MQLQQRLEKVSKINKSGRRSKWCHQNTNFYCHIFNSAFLLTQHSFVFQIINRNWKHLVNCKVQAKNAVWHRILHSYLFYSLCIRFLTKLKSTNIFSKTYFEMEGTFSINSINKEVVLSCDGKYLNTCTMISAKFLIKIESM